jgi:hypothetical protein
MLWCYQTKDIATRGLMALVCGLASMPSFAATQKQAATQADSHSQKIESVLDRLESKYLDKEAAPLTYDDSEKSKKALDAPPVETKTITPREPIIGKTPNQSALNNIQAKIKEHESQIDILEADARKMKSELIEGSVIDNMISIEAKLKDHKTSGIQALTAKVDGSLLFNQTDPAGMWIPASSIPIYHGPMQPGEHTIEVTAVLTKVQPAGLPLAGWTPQQVTKAFKVHVPDGKAAKIFTVELSTTDQKSGKAHAEIKDVLIPSKDGG